MLLVLLYLRLTRYKRMPCWNQTLKQLSFQNLANLVEFGAKEYYMECVNSFIVENKSKIVKFIEELGNKDIEVSARYWLDCISHLTLCNQSQLHNMRPVNDRFGAKIETARDLASLYQICKDHLSELQSLSNREVSRLRNFNNKYDSQLPD